MLLIASLAFAQLTIPLNLPTFGSPDAPRTAPVEVPAADARLAACMRQARDNPDAAVVAALQWLEGLIAPATSAPQECLGFAHTLAGRWGAAETAFVAARDARLAGDATERARLGAMAGNAALAGGRLEQALNLLTAAQADAGAASNADMAGAIAADRARALVALGRELDGAQALASARDLAPQDATVWLLSATLARRMEDLASAQGWIVNAARLDPRSPAVGLEAGLIAALAGQDDTARRNWQSVIEMAPQSSQADAARQYLAQLDSQPESP
ncbi:tetratricopeptide repeat protein [Alteraurantiacibacter palmitatis]|uniref:Tetratricopeptide repeat protein n=1 Tax=Alteraurantiacibacter palmitatis TaxID=2054628 RepID=A0ABV7E8N8_9SPHN